MNKRRAKFNFIFVVVLLAVAVALCFASFKLPASSNDFNGLINSISATNDLSEGYFADYDIKTEDVSEEEITNLIDKMTTILYSQGFSNVNVYKNGNQVRVETNKLDNGVNILNIIGSPKTFFISGTEKDTIGEDELEDYAIVGTDVRNAFSTTQFNLDTEYNGITIEFTKAGTKKYHELTRQVAATEASKIYFYIGGEKQTSLEIEESTNDFLSFYSSGYDKNVAQNFALQILMSSTGVDVEIVSYGLASATLESRGVVTSASIFVSLLLLLLILFPVFFKQLGLVADLSVVLGVVFAIFFLEALPVVAMSIAGAVGCIFGLGLLGAVHAMYLNKMKKEFMYLHRLPLSAKTAYKKYWLKVLDICSITFIGGLVLAVWNIPFVSTLGVCLAVFSFVSVFEGLVIFKDFVTWYVTINNKDYKKVNFKKGDINE